MPGTLSYLKVDRVSDTFLNGMKNFLYSSPVCSLTYIQTKNGKKKGGQFICFSVITVNRDLPRAIFQFFAYFLKCPICVIFLHSNTSLIILSQHGMIFLHVFQSFFNLKKIHCLHLRSFLRKKLSIFGKKFNKTACSSKTSSNLS